MLTKEKANYQVKLILSYLPREEYEQIPKDIIDYIENNYEYDEKIKIDSNEPLENQNIDEKAYKLLEKIMVAVEKLKKSDNIKEDFSNANFFDGGDYDVKMTSTTWEKILKDISSEKEKSQKAKELIDEYMKLAKDKDVEIEKLKKSNEELYGIINKIPKFFRKIFIKGDVSKLLG